MDTANLSPSDTERTEPGLIVEDQRSGERRAVVYVDARVVLSRDEDGHTTLTPRDTFASLVGTRLRPCPGATLDVDVGPLADEGTGDAESDDEDPGDDGPTDGEAPGATGDAGDGASESVEPAEATVEFEAVDGVGPETAGQLRTTGFVTERDVREAADEDLLGVSGVGPAALGAIREYLDR